MIQMKSLSHCRHGVCDIDKYSCLCIESKILIFLKMYFVDCAPKQSSITYELLYIFCYLLVFASSFNLR